MCWAARRHGLAGCRPHCCRPALVRTGSVMTQYGTTLGLVGFTYSAVEVGAGLCSLQQRRARDSPAACCIRVKGLNNGLLASPGSPVSGKDMLPAAHCEVIYPWLWCSRCLAVRRRVGVGAQGLEEWCAWGHGGGRGAGPQRQVGRPGLQGRVSVVKYVRAGRVQGLPALFSWQLLSSSPCLRLRPLPQRQPAAVGRLGTAVAAAASFAAVSLAVDVSGGRLVSELGARAQPRLGHAPCCAAHRHMACTGGTCG